MTGAVVLLLTAGLWECGDPVWISNHYYIPVATIAVYLLHMVAMRVFMRKLDKPLAYVKEIKACWNTLLAVFSGIGAVLLVPDLLNSIRTYGLQNEICTSVLQTTNPVVYLFMLSKFAELFDTTVIYLEKKEPIFLHWYHHVATLLYCWDGYAVYNTAGPVFTGMNLCVHTVMYGYYAATYFGRLPNSLRACITALQLLQMVLGISVTLCYLQCTTSMLPRQKINSYCALVMYLSYFVLFFKFYIEQYHKKSR